MTDSDPLLDFELELGALVKRYLPVLDGQGWYTFVVRLRQQDGIVVLADADLIKMPEDFREPRTPRA